MADNRARVATYAYAINAHAPAATPTDWFTIQGSATKVISITRIRVQGRATAGNQYRVSLIKYSTYLTGGTGVAVAAIPLDSSDPTATAVVTTWSGGLPTPGTALGKITDESIHLAVLGTPAAGLFPDIYDFGTRPSKPIVLRGITEYLSLNSAAVALPAGSVFDVSIETTEE